MRCQARGEADFDGEAMSSESLKRDECEKTVCKLSWAYNQRRSSGVWAWVRQKTALSRRIFAPPDCFKRASEVKKVGILAPFAQSWVNRAPSLLRLPLCICIVSRDF